MTLRAQQMNMLFRHLNEFGDNEIRRAIVIKKIAQVCGHETEKVERKLHDRFNKRFNNL